jgi:hypothetical protein
MTETSTEKCWLEDRPAADERQLVLLNETERRLVGAWRLVDSYDVRADGEIVRSRGLAPRGRLVYDAHRGMSVQVMNDGRPRPSSAETPEAAEKAIVSAFRGYTAYFGSFEVNEQGGYILHHMRGSLNPGEVGQVRKRFYEFRGDQIVLTTPPLDGRVTRIIWKPVPGSQFGIGQ